MGSKNEDSKLLGQLRDEITYLPQSWNLKATDSVNQGSYLTKLIVLIAHLQSWHVEETQLSSDALSPRLGNLICIST